jgi:hypothetical protein
VADKKISLLPSLATPVAGDLFPIVDISEPADADKNKKISYSDLETALVGSIPDWKAGTEAGFHSLGIDDNCSGERWQLGDTNALIGSSVAASNYRLYHNINDGYFQITGGNAGANGASVRVYGSTHGSQPLDFEVWAGAVIAVQHDDSANLWNFQANAITTTGVITGLRFTSTQTTGTAPFTVASTTKVTNLNADQTDGYSASIANAGLTLAVRDASGDINSRLFRSEYDTTNATIGYIMTQIDTVSNNYIRPSTPTQLKNVLDDEAWTFTQPIGFDNVIEDKIRLWSTTYGIGINSGDFSSWADTAARFTWRNTSRTGTIRMTLQEPGGPSSDTALILGGGHNPAGDMWSTVPTTDDWGAYYTHCEIGTTNDYQGACLSPGWNATWNESGTSGWEAYVYDGTGTGDNLNSSQGGYFWGHRAGGTWYGASVTPAVAGKVVSLGGNQYITGTGNVNVGSIQLHATTLSATNNCAGKITLHTGGTERGVLDYLGNFTVDGDVTAYSDIRLKENITPIENALDKVRALNGVMYDRKDSGERKIGLVAQDVYKVVPEVVHIRPNDSEDSDSMQDVMSLAYGNLVGLLIEAIKELETKI